MSSPASIHREFVDLWNRRDFDAIRNLCHPDYAFTGQDGKEITGGPEVAVQVGRMWAGAFPDAKLEVRNVYTQGNTAIAEMVGRGTHNGEFMGFRPTGKQAQCVICNVLELRDGKVYREREYLDVHSILTQLGVAGAPSRTARA